MLYVIGMVSQNDGKTVTGYSDKIFQVKLTPGQFHKLRTYQLNDEKKEKDLKINLKDEQKTYKFLAAAKIYFISLLPNGGLLSITHDGIFYINGTWVNFMVFEKGMGERYHKEYKNFQIPDSCFISSVVR